MGLFSSLKNLVTGGGAKISLEALEPVRGRPFKVRVTVQVGETECTVNKVYLHVRASEKVEVPDVEVAEKTGDKVEARKRTVSHTESTFQHEQEVAPASVLAAGQTYQWECEVTLPPEVLPSFTGKYARHEWTLLAGLDMRGNDPDSGWISIQIA
jgi:hypothetical protein